MAYPGKAIFIARPTGSVVLRYGLAVVSVAAAFGLAHAFLYFHLPQPFTAFALSAIAITFWYGGTMPGILAALLSLLVRNHFFGIFEPEVDTLSRALYDLVFLIFAQLMIWHRREVRVAGETAELTRANETLRFEIAERERSEDRIRVVLNTTPALIHSGLPNGDLVFFNQRWLDYVGLSLEDLSGWKWTDTIHPADVSALVEKWRAALAAGGPFEHEARVRRADGVYRWMLHRKVPLHNESGNIVRWYGTSSDIEALKTAEDRIRLIIDTIPTMAWSVRPDGAVDFVNQRWLDYTGLSLEDEIAEPTRAIHPEDFSRVMEKWRVDMAAGEPFEDEIRLRRADGEYRWFLVRTAPLLDQQGNLVKWYGSSIDIEDRKQAERQSRELIDAIPQQIWSGPPDGTLDYCNGRWRSDTGLGLEELQGAGWQSMLHPDDRDRVLQAWHESTVNGTAYEQEERHRRADGTYRWFLARGVPLRNSEGAIVRWYGTNTDIEDRKQAEEDLRHISEQLLRLQDDERRRIARDLHDSTGQDLVALAIMLGQLRPSIPSGERKSRRLLSECRALADRCIRDVRTLSYALHPPVLDAAGLGDAIRDYVDGFAKRSGVQVELELPGRLGRMPRDVELALFRIVQEAIANVQRHSGSQQARIRIHVNSNLTLEISDSGHGASVLRRKGNEVSRLGIGVGIPSMEERVKLIGGRLDIESTNHGTTVRVTMPLGGEYEKTPNSDS